jgi:hypothetical protein
MARLDRLPFASWLRFVVFFLPVVAYGVIEGRISPVLDVYQEPTVWPFLLPAVPTLFIGAELLSPCSAEVGFY